MGSSTLVQCIYENKGIVHLCIEKASYFPFFSIFHHWICFFQKDLKQEFSQLVTGDIASCSRYQWKAHLHNWPIGIVFSKDASIPTWDISNLGVDCDEIAMSWIDSQVFNLFEVERNFLVPNAVVT